MKMWKDRKGISPIVGVILVVAMTVMLGIIAWNYLGGMASSGPSKVYQVGVTVKQIEADKISVTYVGGPDKDKLVELRFSGVDSNGNAMEFYWVKNTTAKADVLYVKTDEILAGTNKYLINTSGVYEYNTTSKSWKKLGDSPTWGGYSYIPVGLEVRTDDATAGRDHVIVIAVFSDGTEQTIYDDYV